MEQIPSRLDSPPIMGGSNVVIMKRWRGSQVRLRLYTALAGRPQSTDDLSMGLTISSKYKQEISSVYQFIDVLYNLRS